MSRFSELRRKIEYRYNLYLRNGYIKFFGGKLKNRHPSIIASNCWGGIVYQDLNLPYLSPFVNMYMFIPCYIRMLRNLNHYLAQELVFVPTSKYEDANRKRAEHWYPIGVLADIEIHFIHYNDEAYTKKKWEERLARFDRSNVLVVMSERDGATEQLVREFDALPYANKACFTRKRYGLRSEVFLPVFSGKAEVPGADEMVGVSYWRLPLVPVLNRLAKSKSEKASV